ncbi:MAG: hypothetical protein KAG61_02295 [Bacteriovoracaceae bacterium]|nr:hypothetical protein [Bacteriovoracaceae bacterium]
MKGFWNGSWGYSQNFLVLICTIVNGFFIEYISGVGGISVPPFPTNLYFLIAFISISSLLFYLPLCQRLVKWILSFQFVITAISLLAGLSLISGFLPQGSDVVLPMWLARLGLHHITSSVPYAIILILICFSLFCAVMKRFHKMTAQDIPFILNHLGLLTIFLAGSLGVGDLTRVKMTLTGDNVVWMGEINSATGTGSGKTIEMPFALKLKKFTLEQYPPRLAFIRSADSKVISMCPMIRPDALGDYQCKLGKRVVKVSKYFSNGFLVKGRYLEANHTGSSTVMKVSVSNGTEEARVGWITPGSTYFNSAFLEVGDGLSLAIPTPRPKKFMSDVKFYTPEGDIGDFTVLVNKPYKLKNWKLYQYGYDDRMGKWSTTSTIEAISDPWLPVVYTGIFLLMFGTIAMLFVKKEEEVC